ncbi:hypothetical protein M8J77_016316 [Diaphorina citri]|nr:hypothetical protein M8J77_016316 [Diaphorina citri]
MIHRPTTSTLNISSLLFEFHQAHLKSYVFQAYYVYVFNYMTLCVCAIAHAQVPIVLFIRTQNSMNETDSANIVKADMCCRCNIYRPFQEWLAHESQDEGVIYIFSEQ